MFINTASQVAVHRLYKLMGDGLQLVQVLPPLTCPGESDENDKNKAADSHGHKI